MEPNQTQLPSTDTGPGVGPQAAALQAPLPQVAVPAGPTLEQQQNLREMRSLRDEFTALRRLVMVSLAGLTVMAWAFGVFAWRQMTFSHRQLEENRLVIADFESNLQPLFRDLLNKLQVYAASNPDFRPVLNRHFQAAPAGAPPAGVGGSGASIPAQPKPPGR